MGDYYLSTWYTEVAPQVVERLKTWNLRKLGNVRKVSKLHKTKVQGPIFLSKKTFVDTSRKLLKTRNETFLVVCYFTLKIELVSNICELLSLENCF